MKDIKIALAQFCPQAGKTAGNAEKAAEYIKLAAEEGAALVVFPECSLTGYAPVRAAELAIGPSSEDGNILQKTEQLCGRLGIAACFGFMERAGSELFITQELFSPESRAVYRKTHLGATEERYFSQGSTFPKAEVSGISCGMQLCWESHIPQISAAYRKQGCQLLLFPYASPMSGEKCLENWSVHLPARASDNGCFAAACNLLFEEGRGGGLAVWDPKGRLIASCFEKEEKMITCSIGGELPGERHQKIKQGLAEPDMHFISYFDKARSELF